MKTLGQICAAGLIGGAALLLSASSAGAYVVCNDKGDCWHATTKFDDPTVHVTYYDDNWDWKSHSYRWHEVTDEPGYWDSTSNAWVKKTTTTTTTTTTGTPQ